MTEIRILRSGDEQPLFGFLCKRTDSVNLMLSNLGRVGLKREDMPYEGCYAGLFENGQLIALAVHYWNGMLFIEAPHAAARLARLAVEQSGYPLRGFYGPADEVAAAREGLGVNGAPTRLAVTPHLMVLDLDALRLPEQLRSPETRVRRARAGELELLANWQVQFELEVAGAAEGEGLRRQTLDSVARMRDERRIFVLETAGRLVACAGFSGCYGDLAQVGSVWTLPTQRSKGYGRAAVAGMLRIARSEGVARASLIADDPAAMRAYQAVGFETIGRVALVYLREEVPWRLSA